MQLADSIIKTTVGGAITVDFSFLYLNRTFVPAFRYIYVDLEQLSYSQDKTIIVSRQNQTVDRIFEILYQF